MRGDCVDAMTPPPGPKRRSQLTEDDYTRARCYLQLWSQAHWEHGEARRGLVIGCILVRQRLTDADILRLTGTYAPLHKIAQRWGDSPRRRWWRRGLRRDGCCPSRSCWPPSR